MKRHTYALRPEWVVAFSMLLCIAGMSILVPTCHGATGTAARHASAAAASPTPAVTAPAPQNTREDFVEDHWNDRRYRKEAIGQMGVIAGIAALLIVKGIVAKHQPRRSMRHA